MSKAYETIIGLEVHCQLKTKTKLFCACPNEFGKGNNVNICPICSGQPGTLPVLNRHAVDLGIRAAIAIDADIQAESIFARKNYFYPDLPKGYQITQYEKPYCKDGKLRITLKNGNEKTIGVTRIHFEEDAGKSIHEGGLTKVNLNRAGVPLVEIVSEPDLRSSEEAGQYLRALRSIVRYTGVSDGNMEEGSFRCDANVSVRPRGQKAFGTKVELKNINSFRFIEKAIDYEVERQIDLIEQGKPIVQETRLWNVTKNISESMRTKEDAHDYRYFPEPDLPSLEISEDWIQRVKENLPELPERKKARFMEVYHLPEHEATLLTETQSLADYFEQVGIFSEQPLESAKWIGNTVLGSLKESGKRIEDIKVSPKELGTLIRKLSKGEISGNMAKTIFEEMFETGKKADEIIEEKGLSQVNDASQLEPVVNKILQEHPEQVQSYKAGKTKLLGFFVGQVMKETKGQANPAVVNQLVTKALKS